MRYIDTALPPPAGVGWLFSRERFCSRGVLEVQSEKGVSSCIGVNIGVLMGDGLILGLYLGIGDCYGDYYGGGGVILGGGRG